MMKTKIKNLDEVVFEKRNQNYGAFFLRRSYNKIVTRALFAAIFLFLGIVSIPLIASYMKKPVIISIEHFGTMDPNLKLLDKNDIEEVKKQDVKPVERILPFTPPIITEDPDEVTGDLGGIMEGVNNQPISGDGDSLLIIDEKPVVKPITTDAIDTTFMIVQYPPSFKGGESAMYDWLKRNMSYPEMAKGTNITGTVNVMFVIEKDGSISNVSLLNDIGGGCGNEAVRVVKAMPKWNEGRQNNRPVKVQYVLPIKFTLD